MTLRQNITLYYRLTKPGIVYGNAIAAIAGYFYGAAGNPSLLIFTAMLLGINAVMASACVFNNVMDRGLDSKMKRTKKRAVVTGQVSSLNALVFASVLLILGLVLLVVFVNLLAAAIALFGHFAYVILYGIGKRTTVHGTLIGTISGSTPPVIGYVAATGRLDITSLLLFLIMVAWQMPHFYAIAIFRRDDYANAGIPVLSVVKGVEATRRQIIGYVLVFILSSFMLGLWGGASLFWVLAMALTGLYWLYLCLDRITTESINGWARRQFGWSLYTLLIMSALLSVDSFMH